VADSIQIARTRVFKSVWFAMRNKKICYMVQKEFPLCLTSTLFFPSAPRIDMPVVSLIHMPLFAPHDIERRADPNLVLGPDGQLYITNLDHLTVHEKKLYVDGHRRQEALPQQDAQGRQPNSTIINTSTTPTVSQASYTLPGIADYSPLLC